MSRFRTFSDALKEKYGEKVYKVPIALARTCPNRDGLISGEGCIFCGSIGAGYEKKADVPVKEQLLEGISHIGPKYKAKKFIAYFLNFTNTYMPLDVFEKSMEEACQVEGIVALDISTRPDCINDAYLEVLDRIRQTCGYYGRTGAAVRQRPYAGNSEPLPHCGGIYRCGASYRPAWIWPVYTHYRGPAMG